MTSEFRDPVIRTAPMPSDCNNNGDIFCRKWTWQAEFLPRDGQRDAL